MPAVSLFIPFLIAQAVGLVFGIVIIIGAVKMMRLNSHGMATVASVLAMLPCGPAWLLGLPMGIWSLVVLNRRQVKTAFQAQARSRGGVAGVESSAETTGAGPVSLPPLRPKLVPVMAALNLCLAILLLLVYSGEDPLPFGASTPLIWRVWNQVEYVLGFALSAGLFASSIGLFLWKNWARRLLIGLCVLGLVLLVVGMPFYARALFPHMAAEMSYAYAEAEMPLEEQPISPEAIVFVIAGACLLVGLPWLIAQLVYFTRPRLVAAFEPAANVARPEFAIADSERPTKPTVSPRGTLARAWHEWWSERDRWFTRAVQTVLILVHFGCLWMFLSFHFASRDAEGRRGISVRIGLPSPWFTYETDMEPNVPFRQQINLLSSSLVVATIGLLAYYVYWRIEKTKADSKLAVWSSPTAMLIVWATLSVAAIVLQLSIASSEGRRKPASKLGDPNAVIFDNAGPMLTRKAEVAIGLSVAG